MDTTGRCKFLLDKNIVLALAPMASNITTHPARTARPVWTVPTPEAHRRRAVSRRGHRRRDGLFGFVMAHPPAQPVFTSSMRFVPQHILCRARQPVPGSI